MLKITRRRYTAVTRLTVEGTLGGVWVDELERCWRQVSDERHLILLELRDVRFVDDAGRELLKEMARAGVELIAHDMMLRDLALEVAG